MTALVTGASRGIGRAVALRLALDGIPVVVNYREQRAAAAEVVEAILNAGGRACAIGADTGDADAVARMFAEAESRLGPVRILINNAGILRRGTIDTYDAAAMAEMVRTNLDGVIHCTRAALASMRGARDGRIVNLSSIAAHGTSAAGTTWYAATKSAVETLTRRFALELGPDGIRVNAVAPGFILTDMVDPANREAVIAAMAAKAVLGRVGTPDDIADAVAFLVSDQARFITGQILTVDGGRTDFLSH
jgi:NAD(P)-dependent dehydrogenase (short-subunit alcohol dehydrogenase family)